MCKTGHISASKNWMRYADYLMSGEWHIHTAYTDGENSVDDYCRKAALIGVPLLVFSEHVRRTMDYDFYKLLDEIEIARGEYPGLVILPGCEAKVLSDGSLDVSEDVLDACVIVLMAFHSFPVDVDTYLAALEIALTNPRVDIWAHPGLFLVRNNIVPDKDRIEHILELAVDNDVLIEINKKYNLPPKEWVDIRMEGVTFVRGGDIHRLEDFIT